MKIQTIITLFFLSLTMLTGRADESDAGININKDVNGSLTETSSANAELLLDLARDRGVIEVWVTANVQFDPDEDRQSLDEIAARDARVQAQLIRVLSPLIAQGLIWPNPGRPEVEGPGCSVLASPQGLAHLISNAGIRNIYASQ